jgi:FtsH-binding integral membrane protein
MENIRSTDFNKIEYTTLAGENKLLRNSFAWMALAMLLTSLAALLFAFTPEFASLLFAKSELGLKPTGLAYIVMFAPLAFILAINFGLNRMSYPVLIAVFISFAVVMGMSLSSIFYSYEINSIATVFLSTTALFALMAIAGYTTKTDLTKMGSLLIIGLFGIIIASVINMFMGSEQLDYLISIIGVIIFTGLTAYDVQKIKNLGQQVNDDATLANKLGIIGALTLYLDFVNLFLFLLRLFGGKKD